MRKSILIIFALLSPAVLLTSCSLPGEQDGPANAIVKSYTALSRQDSAEFMQTLSHDREEVFEALPAAQHALLARWKGQHPDVQVLSVQQDHGVATVLYNLKVTGRDPSTKDSILDRAYLTDAGWKLGY